MVVLLCTESNGIFGVAACGFITSHELCSFIACSRSDFYVFEKKSISIM